MQLIASIIFFCMVHSVSSDCRAVDFGIEKLGQVPEGVRDALESYLNKTGYAVGPEDSVTRYLLFSGDDNSGTRADIYVTFVQKNNTNHIYLEMKPNGNDGYDVSTIVEEILGTNMKNAVI
ncbi:hypothetical protein OSTOST_23928 [Ostertagia ostertagi]